MRALSTLPCMSVANSIALSIAHVHVVKQHGKVEKLASAELVKGKKYIALYFSAHWCPPCRQFTPALAEMYEDQGGDVETEVVFVSSDSDGRSFDDYYASMPWAAVPFDAAALRKKLGAKFGVSGIPCLVVLDAATGSLVTTDGRTAVMKKRALKGAF